MALAERPDPVDFDNLPPTIVDVFVAAATEVPNRTAIIIDDEQATYRQYRDAAAALASQLSALEIVGERVVLLMGNSIEMAVAMQAVWASGGIVVPFNPLYTGRELGAAINDVAPKVILYHAPFAEKVLPLADAASVPHRLIMGPGGTSWTDLASAGGDFPGNPPGPDDIGLLQFTGGTTGVPKGAQHTHQEMIAASAQVDWCWPGRPEGEVWLNVAPQFHAWGLVMNSLVPVFRRDTAVIARTFDPGKVLAAFAEHKVTLFAGGPAPVFTALMGHPDCKTTDFSNLRLCGGGGSAIPNDVERAWREISGSTILEAYGMSEGAPISITTSHGNNKVGTCGPAAQGVDIRVVDVEDSDKVLPQGEDGEICFRGPQMMKQYWNRPEESAEALRGGWMHTGDIGHLDQDGEVVVVDRKKDMAIVNGYNVYPREIDEVLFNHPDVLDAAAVGVPNEKTGEVIHAYVVRHEGSQVDADALASYCQENLVRYKLPAEIILMESLPMTPAAKPDKVALRKRSVEGNH